jgi:CRISPR-associated endonuclease/helicase Cas3
MVWAKSKPFVPLRTHLDDVCMAAERLLSPARYAAFQRLGIGEQLATELVRSAAWLHDFGKATTQWQDAIVAGRKPPQHSLTSFIASLWAFGATNVEAVSPEFLAVSLAVLGHHGQMSKSSFQRDTFRGQTVNVLPEAWEELVRDLPVQVSRQRLPEKLPTEQLCNYVAAAKEGRCIELARRQAFRALYCLLLTTLVDADHAASGGGQISAIRLGPPNVPGKHTAFQTDVRQHPAEVLCAIAGCGSGKTAAALLRAAEYAESGQADRVVLCLPTRFTSNSLLRDMSDQRKYSYCRELVGLAHGEALNVLRSLPPDPDNEPDVPESPDEQALRRIGVRYEHPITISTVDHLLMSLYHGYKFSDRAFGNLLSSLVVFDEVHAYDALTLNAIKEGLAVLQANGIPTLFMSATLPSSRRQFFGLSNDRTIIEVDNSYRPFQVRQLSSSLTSGSGIATEASDTARGHLRQSGGLKVAVYVNQVERAKAIARAACQELPGSRVYCYHGELAPRDRIRLEARIIRWFKDRRDLPVILVATQAAELSLDISADRMITEHAPADVLVQRAGRLHRRGSTHLSDGATGRLRAGFGYELFIAPVDMTVDTKGNVPGALPYKDIAVLERTWQFAPWDKIFDFQIGLKWCEDALTEDPGTRECGLLAASVTDAVFGNKPQENFGEDGDVGLVTIRERDDEPIAVVPEIYVGRLGTTMDRITPFLVPLRRHKYMELERSGFIEDRFVPLVLGKGMPARERTISYRIRVVHRSIPYDARYVGFDLRDRSGGTNLKIPGNTVIG